VDGGVGGEEFVFRIASLVVIIAYLTVEPVERNQVLREQLVSPLVDLVEDLHKNRGGWGG